MMWSIGTQIATTLTVYQLLQLCRVDAFNVHSMLSQLNHAPTKRHTHLNLGLYRKFHERGWDSISPDASSRHHQVPSDLQTNTSPVKNTNSTVVAEIRSTSTFPSLDTSSEDSVLRLARSAFLETQTANNEALITPMTIHVLNFVLFPNTNIRDVKTKEYIGLPVFGADIVSLPGNKHLVAIDFQPVLPISTGENMLPEKYFAIESNLKDIHAKYQRGDTPILPWGGDIPPQATRFFSPYALWTRLSDEGAIEKVNDVVWAAFKEYLALYLELIRGVQEDVAAGNVDIIESNLIESGDANPVWQGQVDYLQYRRANDPARPMLQRLYGDDWTERVISQVLFPDIISK